MSFGALVLCVALMTTDVAESGPLFAPDESAFGRFIDNEPPPMRWVLDGFLPAEVVGLIAATGGVGKSYLAYSLGFSVATGCPFAGFDVGEEGSFLYLAAEDDEGSARATALEALAEKAGTLGIVVEVDDGEKAPHSATAYPRSKPATGSGRKKP